MELLKIAIIEDELTEIDHMLSLLNKFQREKGASFSVFTFQDGASFFASNVKKFDILFCDIELPGQDGMEIAKKIRELDEEIVIVFVTHISRLAMEGYSVSAFQYMLKPISEDGLFATMTKIGKLLDMRDKKMISLNTGEGFAIVPTKDILYVTVDGHRCICHMPKQDISCWMSMKKISDRLVSSPFALCASGCLVNLHYVKDIEENVVVLENGEKLRMSISKKKTFLKALSVYFGVMG